MEFSYERAEGFVTFDTTKTSPEEFLAELDRMTDFSGTVRAEASSESMSHDAPEGGEEHGEYEDYQHQTGNDGASS